MDKDWNIGVLYQAMSMKLDLVDPGKQLKTIALDTTATNTNVTWAFDGVSTEDPQIGYESYWDPKTMKLTLPTKGSTMIGMPAKTVPTVAMSFGQQDGTPWALKCWACVRIPYLPGPSAEEQYIAVLSPPTDLNVVVGLDKVIKNLVIFADSKVVWDFSAFSPTGVDFKFSGDPLRSDKGPFDSIQGPGTGSYKWQTPSDKDTGLYGHYKYTVVIHTSSGDVTIDPTVDYLPPPATYPIHCSERRGAGLRRDRG